MQHALNILIEFLRFDRHAVDESQRFIRRFAAEKVETSGTKARHVRHVG